MKSNYDYDVIRDYLHGLVDQETARRVRELIRTDDVARNIAAGILQLDHDFNGNEDEIDSYIDQMLRKQLKLIDNHEEGDRSRVWIRVAAAVLVIAASGFVLWSVLGNEDVLDRELRSPYPLASLQRGSDNNPGFQAYVNGEYNKAIKAFDSNSTDATVILYNGLSHLYAGDYDAAVTLLGTLRDSRYRDQALWYQTLALMKSGRKEEAKKNLEQISSNPDHYKSAAARELLSSYKD